MADLPEQNPAQPVQRQQGSGFTNLSRLLQANRNNRLGEAISSGVVGGANQVRQQLGDTREQFQNQSNANDLASDQNKSIREGILSGIANGQTDINDQQAQQFQNFRQGQYTGPKELDQAKTVGLGIRANEVQNQAKNPLSEGTLQATVGAQSQNPYTRGQMGLDRTLLGVINPAALGQARTAARGLTQGVDRAQEAARGQAALNIARAQQFGQETQQQLQAPQTAIQTDVNNRIASQQAALSAEMQKYDKDRAAYLGVTPAQTYGLNLNSRNDLVNFQNPSNFNVNSETDPGQLAKLNALAKLSGTDQSFVTDPSQVGSALNAPISTVDRDMLQRASAARQGEFQGQLGQYIDPIQAQINKMRAPTNGLGVFNTKPAEAQLLALQQLAGQYGQQTKAPFQQTISPTGPNRAAPAGSWADQAEAYLKQIQGLANKPVQV